MSRVAVCLFFIAIFQSGIRKSTQTNNSSTEVSTDESKKEENITTKEPIKDLERTESKNNDSDNKSDNVTTDEPKKDKKISNESKEDKHAKAEESKKEKDVSSGDKDSNKKKTLKSYVPINADDIEIRGHILTPVIKARAQISEAVTKGVDGAKDIADGAFNFFRNAFVKLF